MLHRRLLAPPLLVATLAACDAPAASPDDCADVWRAENATDCRVRLAMEAWDRSPAEGERAIEALPAERLEQDSAWLQVVETRCWSKTLCERIVEPMLADWCRTQTRPWLHAEGTERCPTGMTVCGSGRSRGAQLEGTEGEVVLADPPASAAYADDRKLAVAPGAQATAAAGEVQRVVRGSKGRIETCVQNALMCNAEVAGHVGASWSIVAGKVEGVAIVTNTTGDDELGACIVKAVRSMRFDPGFSGTVDEYAWVVKGP